MRNAWLTPQPWVPVDLSGQNHPVSDPACWYYLAGAVVLAWGSVSLDGGTDFAHAFQLSLPLPAHPDLAAANVAIGQTLLFNPNPLQLALFDGNSFGAPNGFGPSWTTWGLMSGVQPFQLTYPTLPASE